MGAMQVFKADLEHWAEIEALSERFLNGPLKKRFDIDKEGLKGYFKLSQVDPRYIILCIREDESGPILGFALVYEILISNIYRGLDPQSFFHVGYMDPKAPLEAGALMNQAIDEWGRSRNHSHVTANVRVGKKDPFKLRAAEKRYGYKPLYITIGKPLWASEGG